jgi:hypothetical protein
MHTLHVYCCVSSVARLTMTLNRCDCCHGRRKITGLGGIERDCGNCKGVGHVKCKADPDVVVKRKRRTPAEMLADSKVEG